MLDPAIKTVIKRYQSLVLLDSLVEFRDDFVSRIVSRWLRATLMPKDYDRQCYEKRIETYFARKPIDHTERLTGTGSKHLRGIGPKPSESNKS